jgi:hypothetical protein
MEPDSPKHQIFLQLLQEPLSGSAKETEFRNPDSIGGLWIRIQECKNDLQTRKKVRNFLFEGLEASPVP